MRMYPNILRLSMFMRLREGQWTLLVSSCLRSINRVNLRAREHADSQNIWIHPRICWFVEHRCSRHGKREPLARPLLGAHNFGRIDCTNGTQFTVSDWRWSIRFNLRFSLRSSFLTKSATTSSFTLTFGCSFSRVPATPNSCSASESSDRSSGSWSFDSSNGYNVSRRPDLFLLTAFVFALCFLAEFDSASRSVATFLFRVFTF